MASTRNDRVHWEFLKAFRGAGPIAVSPMMHRCIMVTPGEETAVQYLEITEEGQLQPLFRS